jgi:hypothetical protein
VEKIRINPGNFADGAKKFTVIDYENEEVGGREGGREVGREGGVGGKEDGGKGGRKGEGGREGGRDGGIEGGRTTLERGVGDGRLRNWSGVKIERELRRTWRTLLAPPLTSQLSLLPLPPSLPPSHPPSLPPSRTSVGRWSTSRKSSPRWWRNAGA